MEATKPEAQAVAELVEKYHKAEVIQIARGEQSASLLLIPRGMSALSIKEHLDEYLTAPERRSGTASFEDLDSFIAHSKRFADGDSALFASSNREAPKLTSVIDYHRKTSEGAPRFGKHRGEYAFPISDEWKAWNGHAGVVMQQEKFAAFIEDRLVDVLDPAEASDSAKKFASLFACDFASPSRLLELSKGLALRVGVKVQNAVNLGTGEVQLNFVTDHTDSAGGPLKVPGAFLVGIPVFRNGQSYKIPVRLRYRTRDGVVTWTYEPYRMDAAFDDAFTDACLRAKAETELPLFYGAPES